MTKYLIILLIVITNGFIKADTQQEMFLKGVEYYNKHGMYEEALKEFDAITDPGMLVWFNKGLCYYALKDYVHGLAAFKHAQVDAGPVSLLALYPLIERGQEACVVQKLTTSYKYLHVYASCFSVFWLQLLFLFVWSLTIIGASKNIIKKDRYGLLLGALVLLLGGSLSVSWYCKTQIEGIVLQAASMYSGPNKNFHEIQSVVPGETVFVSKKRDNWYKIISTKGSGWIEQVYVERISN